MSSEKECFTMSSEKVVKTTCKCGNQSMNTRVRICKKCYDETIAFLRK